MNASSSTDDLGIVNYIWEFEYNGEQHRLYGKITEFKFEIEGIYDIKLTVKDGHNNIDTDTFTVKVLEERIDYTFYFQIIGVLIVAILILRIIIKKRRIKS